MVREFLAIYEHGVLRPLEPLDLGEMEKVSVTVRSDDDSWLDADALTLAEREGDATISLSLVRERLGRISGSLAESVIAEEANIKWLDISSIRARWLSGIIRKVGRLRSTPFLRTEAALEGLSYVNPLTPTP